VNTVSKNADTVSKYRVQNEPEISSDRALLRRRKYTEQHSCNQTVLFGVFFASFAPWRLKRVTALTAKAQSAPSSTLGRRSQFVPMLLLDVRSKRNT